MQNYPDLNWQIPPAKLVLAQDEVHVWRASLEVPSSYLAQMRGILSSDERVKADRFAFEEHRQNFVVAHGFLRAILSRYVDCAPVELQFGCAKYGKPFLIEPATCANLSFNMAHSGSFALYGISKGRMIGVDIEQIRPGLDIAEIAWQFFSINESNCLLSMSSDVRVHAFFDCWTRKEAFVKAKGIGLSLPLDQFAVTLSPEEPVRLLETRWDKNEFLRWSLRAIDVATGYAAAFAVEGHDWQAKHWHASIDLLANVTHRCKQQLPQHCRPNNDSTNQNRW